MESFRNIAVAFVVAGAAYSLLMLVYLVGVETGKNDRPLTTQCTQPQRIGDKVESFLYNKDGKIQVMCVYHTRGK